MCCIGDSGYRYAGLIAQRRRPDPDGGHHEVGLDVAVSGVDRCDAAAGDLEAGDLDVAEDLRTVSLRFSSHRLGRPGRLRVDVRGDVDRSQDALRHQREKVARLGGAQNVRLDAPATAVPSLSFQIGEPFRRPGHLQAAHGLGARNAVELQPRPQVDGVASKARHRLRGVDLEDEARSVGRGAAGLEERALVDDDDVPPPKLCQVVCDAATGDPRANDDRPGALRHHTAKHLACPLDETKPVQVTRCYHGDGGWGVGDGGPTSIFTEPRVGYGSLDCWPAAGTFLHPEPLPGLVEPTWRVVQMTGQNKSPSLLRRPTWL